MNRWESTGHHERIDPAQLVTANLLMDREVAEATRRREHYWFAVVAFKVTPPLQDGAILDHESIRQAPLVGCFICEQAWTPEVDRRCPGEPS